MRTGILAALALLGASAEAQTMPPQSDLIDIGGEAEVSRQAAGPELGTVVGLEVFVRNSHGGGVAETRYFWVSGEVLLSGEGGAPYVDLRIVPYSMLSKEEDSELRRRILTQARLLPISLRRDLQLDVDRSAKVFLGGVTFGGEWDLASQARTAVVGAFAELAVDALGVAYASQSELGADFYRTVIAEAGGRMGFEARLRERFAMRLTLVGVEGYGFNLNARGELAPNGDAPGGRAPGYGLQLAQLYTELSAGLRLASSEFALFVRGGQASASTTLTLQAPGERFDLGTNEQRYRFLRVGIRASRR